MVKVFKTETVSKRQPIRGELIRASIKSSVQRKVQFMHFLSKRICLKLFSLFSGCMTAETSHVVFFFLMLAVSSKIDVVRWRIYNVVLTHQIINMGHKSSVRLLCVLTTALHMMQPRSDNVDQTRVLFPFLNSLVQLINT